MRTHITTMFTIQYDIIHSVNVANMFYQRGCSINIQAAAFQELLVVGALSSWPLTPLAPS